MSNCFIGTLMMSHSQTQQADNTDPCINPGNPVFSCMINPKVKGVELMAIPKPQSVFYRTTSSDYGFHPPTYESSPCSYYPKSQRFSKDLSKGGMYCDNCFNTSLDRSRVYDLPNLQHTI